MPKGEKKGITVKIDADLHAEIRQYLEEHKMTMAEFVAQALDNELHPQYQMKEHNNMTQKQFILGLIEEKLEREQTERESVTEAQEDFTEPDEEEPEQEETAAVDDLKGISEDEQEMDGFDEESEDESEDEENGFCMQM